MNDQPDHEPTRFVYRRRPSSRPAVSEKERDRARLEDMRKLYAASADLVSRTTEAAFVDEAGFTDRLTATGIVVHLAEAARNLSENFRETHPDVDWIGLVGLRNRVAHDYLAVDYAIVWRALTVNFPAERRALGLDAHQ